MHQAQIQTANPLLADTNFGSRVAHGFKQVWVTWDRQRQRRALVELDDRQLRDIGKTREEALQEARKPFWK